MKKAKLGPKFWSRYFKVYDVLNMVIPYQELLETIVKELDVKQGDSVLDAGCGTGNLAVKMKNKGAKVIGLDYCIEALNVYKLKDPNADVFVHDLTEPLPFPDNYFDKIASNNVIYAVPVDKREATLKEFLRVLKPKGRIVLANVHKGFKPILIYKDHFMRHAKKESKIKTWLIAFKMVVPTLKMFYYNMKAKKEHNTGSFQFVSQMEQKRLLEKVGFKKISPDMYCYSNQSILNSAEK